MRLAVTIVLTTFLSGSAAEAGKAKKPAPKKTGVLRVIDRVAKDGTVVERRVLLGREGRGAPRHRKVTVDDQVQAMNVGLDLREYDAEMPATTTQQGKLERVGKREVKAGKRKVGREFIYARKGAAYYGAPVETRTFIGGKMTRVRELKPARREAHMRSLGTPVAESIFPYEIPAEDGKWSAMSGTLQLDYQPFRPRTVVVKGTPKPLSIDREMINQALSKGMAGTRPFRLETEGESFTITITEGDGAGSAYRIPTEKVQSFLRNSYKSVVRGDESRFENPDAELRTLGP